MGASTQTGGAQEGADGADWDDTTHSSPAHSLQSQPHTGRGANFGYSALAPRVVGTWHQSAAAHGHAAHSDETLISRVCPMSPRGVLALPSCGCGFGLVCGAPHGTLCCAVAGSQQQRPRSPSQGGSRHTPEAEQANTPLPPPHQQQPMHPPHCSRHAAAATWSRWMRAAAAVLLALVALMGATSVHATVWPGGSGKGLYFSREVSAQRGRAQQRGRGSGTLAEHVPPVVVSHTCR